MRLRKPLVERAKRRVLEELAAPPRGQALSAPLEPGRGRRRPLLPPLAHALTTDPELAGDRREADTRPGQLFEQPCVGVASVAIVEGGDLPIARGEERADRRRVRRRREVEGRREGRGLGNHGVLLSVGSQ
jgi:hypothetical protein